MPLSLNPESLIGYLNAHPPELVELLTLIACFGSILVMQRLFGRAGLFVYIVVAIIGANIQVLKAVQFSLYAHPVALGTILFASTYLCTDILTEHYGKQAARRAVLLGFAALLLFNVMMMLALGYRPLDTALVDPDLQWAAANHEHMKALFLPAPSLFAAGMIAYLVSQYHDIWLYGLLRRLTGGRMLWLRNNASTMLSSLIDNIIFSTLAWVVFAPQPVSWDALIFTYILGTYLLRVIVSLLDTPFMYLSRYCVARPVPAHA